MKTFKQLSKTEKVQAVNYAVNHILTNIIEHGVRFDDKKNNDDLQQRIDKAFEKAEKMQTPWFAHEYIMDTCKADIESMAACQAEDALYSENEHVVNLNEVKQSCMNTHNSDVCPDLKNHHLHEDGDIDIPETEKIERGELIAEILMLKKDKDNRYKTTWGTKTALGLYRTMERIVKDGE